MDWHSQRVVTGEKSEVLARRPWEHYNTLTESTGSFRKGTTKWPHGTASMWLTEQSHVLVCYADGMEKFKQVLIDSEANFLRLVEKMQEGQIQMDQVEALVGKFRRDLKAFEDFAFLLESNSLLVSAQFLHKKLP